MGPVLVIVPQTCGVVALDVFAGLKVVVLDEILYSGFAGVYFRRLFAQAAVSPEKRSEYERKRREYLQRVLQEKEFGCDVVLVGTRASDVDLLDFRLVYVVRVSDKGLRSMSRVVYGDPIMLYMEYIGVLAAVEQAVDETFSIVQWSDLPLLITRKFQNRQEMDMVVHAVKQRAILSDILHGEQDASVWLEDVVYRAGAEKRTMFLADYDYLTFLRPVWRDAVVRLLGKAPSVVEVFRLPWCMVDTSALTSLCYRADVSGRPTASARGYSLVKFVQSRLAGNLTAREMIGTWIGGLLCDDLTAVDTIISLGEHTLAPVDDATFSQVFTPVDALYVPSEFAWMYAAIGGVGVREWIGDRRVDGTPKIGTDTDFSLWASSLIFAEKYASVQADPVMSACVIQVLSRIHSMHIDFGFLCALAAHADDVLMDGCTEQNFDSALTPILPGFAYLAAFASAVRWSAVQVLGCCPDLVVAMRFGTEVAGIDGVVSVDELCADIVRTSLYAGRTMRDVERVGHKSDAVIDLKVPVDRPGFCYECLFKPKYRAKARRILRAYPTMQQLMHWRMVPWYIDNALDVVKVTQGRFVHSNGVASAVLHIAVGGSGDTLRSYVRACKLRSGGSFNHRRVRVGQAGVCYSSMWYVSAIIAWTIVGCVFVGLLVWLLSRRCVGGRSATSGARGFYR